jgi:hypothetical protein
MRERRPTSVIILSLPMLVLLSSTSYAIPALTEQPAARGSRWLTLQNFKGEPQFDGIGFSTTIHLPGKAVSSNGSEAVEFFFSFSALRCYEKYDCSGQQLIDDAVLIKDERVSLDLQIAEAGSAR